MRHRLVIGSVDKGIVSCSYRLGATLSNSIREQKQLDMLLSLLLGYLRSIYTDFSYHVPPSTVRTGFPRNGSISSSPYRPVAMVIWHLRETGCYIFEIFMKQLDFWNLMYDLCIIHADVYWLFLKFVQITRRCRLVLIKTLKTVKTLLIFIWRHGRLPLVPIEKVCFSKNSFVPWVSTQCLC